MPLNYTPLAPGHFRLFELAPDGLFSLSARSMLVGRLLAVDLKNSPPFQAIEYRWEIPHGGLSSILCNGQPIPAQPKVVAALMAIRHPTQPQLVWIDSVCINQEDIGEKSAQVSMIPGIMSMANKVVLYVDSWSENTGAALQLAGQLIEANRAVFGHARWPLPSPPATQSKLIERYRRALPPSSSTAWKAMNNLVGDGAFNRYRLLFPHDNHDFT